MQQHRRRHIRHVARDDNRPVAFRFEQGGVQAAQRTASRDAIGPAVRPADDENIARQRRELRDLAIANRAAVDQERALVAPAEAPCLSAGQDRRAQRHVSAPA